MNGLLKNPLRKWLFVHYSTTCHCHRTACLESLRWCIHLGLYPDKAPQWASKPPQGWHRPVRQVAYCAQQDTFDAGLPGGGIWPVWISSVGWNGNAWTWKSYTERRHINLFSNIRDTPSEQEVAMILTCRCPPRRLFSIQCECIICQLERRLWVQISGRGSFFVLLACTSSVYAASFTV